MAETVRIEIPVSVKDNTSAGVQSATRNMSNFERSMKRTEQQLNRLDRAHHVRVDADDQASGTINRLSSATEVWTEQQQMWRFQPMIRQVRLSIRLKTRLAHWTVRRQMWM